MYKKQLSFMSVLVIGITLVLFPLVLSTGCDDVDKELTSKNGTRIGDRSGSATVYIFEKDGYKFAIAVGINKCSLIHLK